MLGWFDGRCVQGAGTYSLVHDEEITRDSGVMRVSYNPQSRLRLGFEV